MIHPHSHHLGYWIKRYSLLAAREMDAILKPYGLGRTQWYILFHLHESPGMPQRTLQALLQIESATLTKLLATLVDKGWVVQSQDPIDKRSKRLYITVIGKRKWASLPNPIQQVRLKALGGISIQDITAARHVIELAVHNLENRQEN